MRVALALPFALMLILGGLTHAQEPCPPTMVFDPRVSLRWEAPAPLHGEEMLGYMFERRTGDGPWVLLPAPPATATTATDTVTPGQTYTYQLRAQWRDRLGQVALSIPAPHGAPPPCVTVIERVPAPTQLRLDAQ